MLSKPHDYSQIFWQLQKWFPNDTRFNADNFGYQPEWLILEAYEAGVKMQRQELHYQELAIAQLTQTYVNAHLDTKKTKPYSVDSFYHFSSREVSTTISHEASDAFFDLIKDDLIPQWGLAIAPINQLKQVKTGFKPSYPRGAIGEGVIVLNPVFEGTSLRGTLAIIDEGKEQEWINHSENQYYKLLIKIEQERDFNGIWLLNPVFEVLEVFNWGI